MTMVTLGEPFALMYALHWGIIAYRYYRPRRIVAIAKILAPSQVELNTVLLQL